MSTAKDPRGIGALRVVECGQGVSAAFGAKMMADVGAEVIKVEPPGGDLTRRRGPFPNDQADPGKERAVRLPQHQQARRDGRPCQARGTRVARPPAREGRHPDSQRAAVRARDQGLDSAALCAKYPGLIVASISMYGDRGPRANWRGYELNVSNAGGWAYLSPGASPYPELPPLKPFGAQCDFQAGAHAALTSLAAMRHKLRTGKGQAIDVSEQEAIAAMLEMNFMHWTYAGRETSRLGSRALGPWFLADCADGKIFVARGRRGAVAAPGRVDGQSRMGERGDLPGPRVARPEHGRAQGADDRLDLSSGRSTTCTEAAQEARIPFAPVNTMQQMYESEHLRERKFFVPFDQPGIGTLTLPGAPSQYGKIEWSLRRPAPRLGQRGKHLRRVRSAARSTRQAKQSGVV